MTRIAILDDYLDIVRSSADWSRLPADCTLDVFNDNLASEDEAAERLAEFDVLLATRERMRFPASLIDRLPNLKLLVTTGGNNRAIDVEACIARGITVCGTGSAPGRTTEQVWALILGLVKHIPAGDALIKAGGWQADLADSLYGRTLGVLGLGKLGSATAQVGKLFGMNVIAWSPNLTAERCAPHDVELVDKATLFSTADVLSVHMVLSDRTRGLIGREDFERMKPTAYFVNTSRGPLVDEAALVEALNGNWIKGAGLDVFVTEPLPKGHPIRKCKNAILSGHMGYNTRANAKVAYTDALDDILGWLAGEPIRVIERNRDG